MPTSPGRRKKTQKGKMTPKALTLKVKPGRRRDNQMPKEERPKSKLLQGNSLAAEAALETRMDFQELVRDKAE